MPGPPADVDQPVELRGLTRVEYERLVELGAFDGESLELLDGGIHRMAPQGWQHTTVTGRLRRHLESSWAAAGEKRYLVHVHSPIAAGDASEPEPDIYVYDEAAERQAALPSFAHLVVEVAQTSQEHDLGRKCQVYARAGYPEYWVVDLPAREIVVHKAPRRDLGEYAMVSRLPVQTELTVLGVRVRLSDLVPTADGVQRPASGESARRPSPPVG